MTPHVSATRFHDYWRQTAGRPPHATVRLALERFAAEPPRPRRAVDLGCGGGRDTLALLAAGFEVLAIDAEPDAIEALHAAVPAASRPRLHARCERIEGFRFTPVDLVVASFSLPLLEPPQFARAWRDLRAALLPGGRFAGHLFGVRDDWARRDAVTCLDAAAARALLDGLEVEHFEEEESDGVTPRGSAKHWHLFHVVARAP